MERLGARQVQAPLRLSVPLSPRNVRAWSGPVHSTVRRGTAVRACVRHACTSRGHFPVCTQEVFMRALLMNNPLVPHTAPPPDARQAADPPHVTAPAAAAVPASVSSAADRAAPSASCDQPARLPGRRPLRQRSAPPRKGISSRRARVRCALVYLCEGCGGGAAQSAAPTCQLTCQRAFLAAHAPASGIDVSDVTDNMQHVLQRRQRRRRRRRRRCYLRVCRSARPCRTVP